MPITSTCLALSAVSFWVPASSYDPFKVNRKNRGRDRRTRQDSSRFREAYLATRTKSNMVSWERVLPIALGLS